MDTLPSPSLVAKNHLGIYEALYQLVDPIGTGKIGAVEAAAFLKKSGLPDSTLMKIWDFSDPSNSGFLTKAGFFTALKLISLAQSGQEVSMSKLFQPTPPPHLQGVGLDPTLISSPTNIDWSIKASEKVKYEEMFASLGPINDRLPGAKVKPVMLNSKLPLETLGKIWDLSDIDQDGFLDKDEFMLAMHLIYKALENIPVPSVLPPDLIPSSKRKKSVPSPVMPDLLPGLDGPTTRRSSTPSLDSVSYKNALNKSTLNWVVSAADKAKFDTIFYTLDQDKDGYVTGTDIKDVFLQSGLPAQVLAHIWNLCNVRDNGKLNSEQFALAMYLVNQKLQGGELPPALTPQMVPPTLRPKPVIDTSPVEIDLISDDHGSPPTPAPPHDTSLTPPLPSTGNKELDLITEEINELQKERQELELDISQKDSELKQKTSEMNALKSEQETLLSMLKQLEIQKGEARKRLDDLDTQKDSLESKYEEVAEKCKDEQKQIEVLKKQVEEQQQNIESQEAELSAKQKELAELQEEESRLEAEIAKGRSQVEEYTKTLQNTQLQINKSKLKISQLQEQKRQMDSALDHFTTAISKNDPSLVPESMLSTPLPIDPESSKLKFDMESPITEQPLPSTPKENIEDFKEDPFQSKDPFAGINGFTTDPFAGEDPFKSELAFDQVNNPPRALDATVDPFASDPFSDAFGGSVKTDDPFRGKDPFGLSPSSAKSDPFGGASFGEKTTLGVDPFGADPFAPQVPPPRPESPTPQLPPKKGKAPPPRPAPPKHASKAVPSRAAPAPPPPPAKYTPSTFTTSETFTSSAPPFSSSSVTSVTAQPDPFTASPAKTTISSAVTEADPFDPFGVATSNMPSSNVDPFAMGSDPFAAKPSADDGFANFANFDQFSENGGKGGAEWPPFPDPSQMSEDDQLAWVTTESLRLEEEERRKREEQEKADYEYALKLSRGAI